MCCSLEIIDLMPMIVQTMTRLLQLSARLRLVAQGYEKDLSVGMLGVCGGGSQHAVISDMDNVTNSSRRGYRGHVFVWDKKFATRREAAYHAESNKVAAEDQQSIVDAFLDQFGTRLDPPQFSYATLRDFLEEADEDELKSDPTLAQHRQVNILLDGRRDNTGWKDVNDNWHRARDWNIYAEEGRPPEGENVTCTRMDAGDLYRKQLQSVSQHRHLDWLHFMITEIGRWC